MIAPDEDLLYGYLDQQNREQIAQDHRILIDEIYKVLYLNNEDPHTYNVRFWAKHFKIDPAAIRNIFNYLGYPIVDPKSKTVGRTLVFIDVDMMNHQEKIKDLTRDDYIRYLEEDYYRRKQVEHEQIMQGISELSSEKPGARHMREAFVEDPITNYLPEYEDREKYERERQKDIKISFKLRETYDDDTILEDIDKEIKQFQTEMAEEKSKTKNHKNLSKFSE